MPPPKGIPAVPRPSWLGGPPPPAGEPPAGHGTETAAESSPRSQAEHGEDRRPLLRSWIREVNRLSAFNRRSRGVDL